MKKEKEIGRNVSTETDYGVFERERERKNVTLLKVFKSFPDLSPSPIFLRFFFSPPIIRSDQFYKMTLNDDLNFQKEETCLAI